MARRSFYLGCSDRYQHEIIEINYIRKALTDHSKEVKQNRSQSSAAAMMIHGDFKQRFVHDSFVLPLKTGEEDDLHSPLIQNTDFLNGI